MENNFLKVLKNANFNRLWGSQILSVFCAYMLNFALSYKLFTLTGKSLSVSLLYVFYYAPVYILGFFSGVFIDHFSRRRILLVTNILQAICVLFYLFIGNNFWLIYAIIFVYSMIDQFYLPAESAYLPELVKKEELPVANSFFNFASFGGLFFGFVLGGPIMLAFGVNAPFYLASLFLWIAALSAFLLPQDTPPKDFHFLKQDFFVKTKEDILENLRFIWSRPKIYFSMLITLFFMMIVAMMAVILPAFGEQVLNINLLNISWIIIFPIAIGAILGAIGVEKRIGSTGKRKLIGLGGLICGLVLLAVYFLARLGESTLFLPENLVVIMLPLVAVLGFGVSLVMIPAQTLLQEETPNQIRGRVFGAQKLLQGIFLIIPTVFSAVLADILGVKVLLLVIGVLILSGTFLSFFYRNNHKPVLAIEKQQEKTEKV